MQHPPTRRLRSTLAAVLLWLATGAIALLPAPGVAQAGSFIVSSLADSGAGTLRQAMLDANSAAGPDVITFGVGGTVSLGSALPAITDPAGLIIDGAGKGVTVSGNHAVRPFTVAGGAAASLRNLAVTAGHSTANGGAVLNRGDLSLIEVGVTASFAVLDGGGIHSVGGLTLANSYVSLNRTMGNGGGIASTGDLAVTDSRIDHNNVADEHGGGIYSTGTLTLTRSEVNDGHARHGGGVFTTGTATIMASSVVWSHAVAGLGGGVYNSGTLSVVNSTISSNNAQNGGGLYNTNGLSLSHTTVSDNEASYGGGIMNHGWFVGLSNALIGRNRAQVAPDCRGEFGSAGAVLVQDPTGCTLSGNPVISGDPLLAPGLAPKGGRVPTHALLPGSPALDVGAPGGCSAGSPGGQDQRGIPRPQGAGCDLGAFELTIPPYLTSARNLQISTAGLPKLTWIGGTTQTAYTLLEYDTTAAVGTLLPLPGTATSHTHTASAHGVVYCYVLAALHGATFLGLSDLLCGMTGHQSGTVIPGNFALALNQTANATMTWTTPPGDADSYLLQRIPLDGSPITNVPLGGAATSTTQAVVAAGTCFQLVAFKGASFGTSDVLCGVPGVSTLNAGAGAAGGRTAADALAEVNQLLHHMRPPLGPALR